MTLTRSIYLAGFILAAALIGTALYMEHQLELDPCPLCVVQRVLVIAMGVVALVAAIHDPAAIGRRIYGAFAMLIGVLGIGVAGRHVWLQNLPPDRVPECGPGLDYMLRTLPMNRVVEMVFTGSGECAEVQWTFLGLSIPGWTVVVFAGVTLVGGWLALASPRSPQGIRR